MGHDLWVFSLQYLTTSSVGAVPIASAVGDWFSLFFLGSPDGEVGEGFWSPSYIWLKTGTPQMRGQLIAWPYVSLWGFDSLLEDNSALTVSWHFILQPEHLPNLAWAENHLVLALVLYSLRCYHTVGDVELFELCQMVPDSCRGSSCWWLGWVEREKKGKER